MQYISTNITYREATKSNTAKRLGLRNHPNRQALMNMKFVAHQIFEPLRRRNGNKPIIVSSFYRSVKLNQAIGGSKKSQHCKGQAIDIDDTLGGMSNSEMFYFIKDNLDFDQLIWEFGDNNNPDWVHVSCVNPFYAGRANRKKVMKSKNVNGSTVYRLM